MRLIYFGAVFLFFGVIFAVIYSIFFIRPATCTDSVKNQNEIDVDCGGACKKVCAIEVSTLIKDWTRFFKIGDGKYDVASLVENPNYNFGIKELDYTFRLYDAENLFITEKIGHTFVNARDKFVIFESSLDTGQRIPVKAIVEFSPTILWSRVDSKSSKPSMVIQNQELVGGQTPRLSAEIINKSIIDLTDVIVTAVIYDEDGNAFAVSQTFLNQLKKGAGAPIDFTWPKSFTMTHTTIEIYPRVNLVDGLE